jgi:hypothetical protein
LGCKEGTSGFNRPIYDQQGRKLYGVREPKKFASMINRLVSFLGHLKLSDITVSHLQQYRRKRLGTKTNRGTYTDVATVNRELSTAMLNDAVVNDWLIRSPFVKAKKGELIAIAHEAKRQVVLTSENEQKLLQPSIKSLFIIAITFLLLTSSPMTSSDTCGPPPTGLLSWWPGDGNANDIAGPNDGTPLNGATFAQEGSAKKCL